MNRYQEMRKRHQTEFDSVPLGAAFSEEQFNTMMSGWGLDPEKDIDKICFIGCGAYIQKKDKDLLGQISARHEAEVKRAIEEDNTGLGFIKEMFLHELRNHEYGYTTDTGDTIESCGYTAEQVESDPRLKLGLETACKEIRAAEGFGW